MKTALHSLDPEYSCPDWMIITVLPVLPPQVRPTIMIGLTSKSEDDLTYKLAEIIKLNTQLRKSENNTSSRHQ
jgi:DNA-directed RNA polymerase II subunit RPB1